MESTPAWGGSQGWMTYDPNDRSFWVVDGNAVDVIPANATANLTASITVGIHPIDVAVDTLSGDVFVTNSISNNVTVINASSLRTVGSIFVGFTPTGIAFDATDNEVFVANQDSNSVSVILGSNLGTTATLAVGLAPQGVAFDPTTDQAFVADSDSYNVTVISAGSLRTVATVPVGIAPDGIALDNASDTIYVSNEGSTNVTVISASSDTVVANIPVLGYTNVDTPIDLQGLVYDSATNQVWVGGGYWYLIVINATAQNVSYIYTADPSGAAYDPSLGEVCVTNAGNSTFQCLTSAAPYAHTSAMTFTETGLPYGTRWSVAAFGGPSLSSDTSTITAWVMNGWWGCAGSFVVPPAAGEVAGDPFSLVNSDGCQAVNVTFTSVPGLFDVGFNETGLPAGTGWNVNFAGLLLEGTSGSLTAVAPNGTFNFTLGEVPGQNPYVASGSLTVDGGPTYQSISFSLSLWTAEFLESGLPSGTAWWVNFTATSSGTLPANSGRQTGTEWSIALQNGTFEFTARTSDPEFQLPGTQDLLVDGPSTLAQDLMFVGTPIGFQFNETGLPSGTAWSVEVHGDWNQSHSNTLTVNLTTGIYPFDVGQISGFRSEPLNGSIDVAWGGLNTLSILFVSTVLYNLTFTESGLPLGTGWSVAIGSEFESGLSASLTFHELNGSYGYVVQTVAGYTTAASGSVNVSGRDVVVDVHFSPAEFPVIIVELGLPNGTNWSVTVIDAALGVNVTHWSTTAAIVFELQNGTYTVSVYLPPGYTANLSSGVFTVAGAGGGAPTVHYTSGGATDGGHGGTSGVLGGLLPVLEGAALGVILTVAVLVGYRFAARRRGGGPSAPPRTK